MEFFKLTIDANSQATLQTKDDDGCWVQSSWFTADDIELELDGTKIVTDESGKANIANIDLVLTKAASHKILQDQFASHKILNLPHNRGWDISLISEQLNELHVRPGTISNGQVTLCDRNDNDIDIIPGTGCIEEQYDGADRGGYVPSWLGVQWDSCDGEWK